MTETYENELRAKLTVGRMIAWVDANNTLRFGKVFSEKTFELDRIWVEDVNGSTSQPTLDRVAIL